MMSVKIATLGLLKIKFFEKKRYDVIISIYDVTNKILSRDSNYNVNVVIWPKFGNSSISVKQLIITLISTFYSIDLARKTAFFEEWSWFKSDNWDWH